MLAWWQGEIVDRVVMCVTAPKDPGQSPRVAPGHRAPANTPDLERWWTHSPIVLARWLAEMENTFFGGEAVPHIWLDFGPSIISAYLGCPMHFATDTTWQDPILDDWSEPLPTFNPADVWWQRTMRLLQAGLEMSRGRYFMGFSDFGGPGDTLAHLRGAQALCTDLIDRPEYVRHAEALYSALWQYLFQVQYVTMRRYQQGSIGWMGVWAPGSTFPLQCDFSAMVSPAMFRAFFLPHLEAQARLVEYPIYHLDGPGALPHLDAILEIPEIRAIQWQPGAGAMPVTRWMDVLKRIQAAGKGLYIDIAHTDAEIEYLINELNPAGLLFRTGRSTPAEAQDLLRKVEKWTARRNRVFPA